MFSLKRQTLIVCTFTLLTQVFLNEKSSFALTPPASTPTPIPGIAPIITPQPGSYEINSRDASKALEKIIDRIGAVQDSDRKYLDEVVQNLIKSTNAYNQLLISGEFKQLSDRAFGSISEKNKVTVEEFLQAINQIREAKLKIETQLQLLVSVSKALPSDAVINDGKVSNQLPSPRNIDFSPLTNAVANRIKEIEAIANNYPFVIQHAEGVQIIQANTGSSLNPKLNFPLMTGERIRELQKQVRILSTPSELFEKSAENHGTLTKGLIAHFIKNYGQSEKYRPRDERDDNARQEAFTNIVNAFWMRSYLRKVYGIRVGTLIPVNYKKRYLNMDKYLVLNDQLTQFQEETGPSQISDSSLADAAENIRNVLETVDERASKILTGDASFLAKINSFITLLKGERPTAEALVMVMALVAADIKEELQIAIGGGLEELVASYDQRWNATELDKESTQNRVCAFDHLAEPLPGKNCFQGQMEGGIKGTFVTLNDEANAQSAKINNSLQIREQIRLAMLAQSMSGTADDKKSGVSGRRGR